MALIPKRISDLFIEVRDTLQDQQKSRWNDQELFRYLDQGNRDITLNTRKNHTKDTIFVADPALPQQTTEYNLSKEAIEFYEITSEQPYEVKDARTIVFPENKEEYVKIEYYAFPDRIIYGNTQEILLDEDLYDAIRYYIIFKCYQKEDNAESFQKSQYFKSEYGTQLQKHLTRWNTFDTTTSRTDFF